MTHRKYCNRINNWIEKKRTLVFFILVIITLGVNCWYSIQRNNELKIYIPQHEEAWYIEKMNVYFDNITINHGYYSEAFNERFPMFIYYFADNPGISVNVGHYTIDSLFSENPSEKYLALRSSDQKSFNRMVNELYYTSLVYEDFNNAVDELLPDGMNYTIKISLDSGIEEIFEFNPSVAWDGLRDPNTSKHFTMYLLIDKTSITDEFDLQTVLEELYQYAFEYFNNRGIDRIPKMIIGAETENLDDYPQFNLEYYFNSSESDFYNSILRINLYK